VDNKRVIYVLANNGSMKQVEILLGASSDVYSEVLEGDLQVGDMIVLNPSSSIFDQGFELGPGQGGPFTRGGGMP
jgi:hypothetical protein